MFFFVYLNRFFRVSSCFQRFSSVGFTVAECVLWSFPLVSQRLFGGSMGFRGAETSVFGCFVFGGWIKR